MNTGCGQLPKSPKVSVRTRHELEVRGFFNLDSLAILAFLAFV
jgi:hypothetical protein